MNSLHAIIVAWLNDSKRNRVCAGNVPSNYVRRNVNIIVNSIMCLILQEIERLTDENSHLRERLKHIESTVST